MCTIGVKTHVFHIQRCFRSIQGGGILTFMHIQISILRKSKLEECGKKVVLHNKLYTQSKF